MNNSVSLFLLVYFQNLSPSALEYDNFLYFCTSKGEVAEWSIAAVLKTVDLQGSGGSNPPFSAENIRPKEQTTENQSISVVFYLGKMQKSALKGSYKGCLFGGHFEKEKSLPFIAVLS